MLNLDKFEVPFAQNVSDQVRETLCGSLGFKDVDTRDRYLGLATYIGRTKKAIFSIIQDQVWKKLK